MDEEGVKGQKEGDDRPSEVPAPAEVYEGEEVGADVTARQQGVEKPEDEYLQHHTFISPCFPGGKLGFA